MTRETVAGIEFSIEVENGLSFKCKSGQPLLREALKAGLGFPYECSSGGCGSCQYELVNGDVADLWVEAPGLSEAAKCRGRHLGCQSTPLSDCRIRVHLNPNFIAEKIPKINAVTFLGNKAYTSDMAEYTFKSDSPAEFLPGQYALLRLPGMSSDRAYSMSNLPNSDGLWSFIVKRTSDGKGSAILAEQLKVGDRIILDAPYGRAYLRSNSSRDIVCVGGGSGMSPIKSILFAALREPALARRKIYLFYGGRSSSDICTEMLFSDEPNLRSRVTVMAAISNQKHADPNWDGDRGFIHEIVDRWLAGGRIASDYEYYFCGPPPMTDALQRLFMIEKKIPSDQLHFDKFL